MQKIRIYLKIFGRVQGINYRWFVIDTAKNSGITGWVRNCSDGSVELQAQGMAKDLKDFENALKNNHPIATIRKIEIQKLPLLKGETDFRITY